MHVHKRSFTTEFLRYTTILRLTVPPAQIWRREIFRERNGPLDSPPMKLGFLAAAIAAPLALAAAPASAAVLWSFAPGLPSPSVGFVVINNFDTADGITGNNFQIKTPPSDGEGAPPANSIPSGTPYLSVLG